jgi:hypothetical protein
VNIVPFPWNAFGLKSGGPALERQPQREKIVKSTWSHIYGIVGAALVTASPIVLAASLAQAGTLATAPIDRAGQRLSCLVTNVGSQPVDVQFQVINDDGTLARQNQPAPLSPGQVTGAIVGPDEGSATMSCRFISPRAKSIRGALCLGSPCTLVEDAR